MPIAIVVHGGATWINGDKADTYRTECLAAVEAGWRSLEGGQSALDAVEAAIRTMEAADIFGVGMGAAPDGEGKVSLDAGLMEGTMLHCGMVAAVSGMRHPISAARLVLESDNVLLTGESARRIVAQAEAEVSINAHGLPRRPLRATNDGRERSAKPGSVGCIALDGLGNIAVGASAGSQALPMNGAVGPAPLVGSGLYADSALGGCVVAGRSKTIVSALLSKNAIDLLAAGVLAEEAARLTMTTLGEQTARSEGCIVIDREGWIGWSHTSPHMACAYRSSMMGEASVFLQKAEEDSDGWHSKSAGSDF